MNYAVSLIFLVACFTVSMTKAKATTLIQPGDEIISVTNEQLEVPQSKAHLVSVGECYNRVSEGYILVTEWRQEVMSYQVAWVKHPFWGKTKRAVPESASEDIKTFEKQKTYPNLETCQQNQLALSKSL